MCKVGGFQSSGTCQISGELDPDPNVYRTVAPNPLALVLNTVVSTVDAWPRGISLKANSNVSFDRCVMKKGNFWRVLISHLFVYLWLAFVPYQNTGGGSVSNQPSPYPPPYTAWDGSTTSSGFGYDPNVASQVSPNTPQRSRGNVVTLCAVSERLSRMTETEADAESM